MTRRALRGWFGGAVCGALFVFACLGVSLLAERATWSALTLAALAVGGAVGAWLERP